MNVWRTVLVLLFSLPLAAATVSTVKPEDVGLSSERLKRIGLLVKSHIDAGALPGAVTLVARQGKVAHLEAHGQMDMEAKKPMQTGTLFRLASMTKPMTAVAILMLMEEGKLFWPTRCRSSSRSSRTARWRSGTCPTTRAAPACG